MSSQSILTNRETIDLLHKISQLLNTGLDKDSLHKCVELLEGGADPQALASVVKELQQLQ